MQYPVPGLVCWLYLDLNSYFASVEQQLHPELRGRAVAVIPVKAETTCCIAASYETKAYGIQTGTDVAEARRLCPEIVLVEASQSQYARFHYAILEAVNRCLPVEQVLSIDEIACRLTGSQCNPDRAIVLGERL
jgi:DNA polymerase IV